MATAPAAVETEAPAPLKPQALGRVRPQRHAERARRAAAARNDARRARRSFVPPRRRAGTPLELGKGSAPPPTTGPLITGSGVAMLDAPREQFNTALQAFQTGQYQQAEDGFKAFMAANSGHRLTPDAIFYIGETYFQRSRPREAAEQYLKVTTDYAKSSRAPESMVRLGQTLAALGNSEQACATFAEFGKRYPSARPLR